MGLANVLQVLLANYVSTSAWIVAETALIQRSAHCVLLVNTASGAITFVIVPDVHVTSILERVKSQVRVCHNAVTLPQLVNAWHVRPDSTVLGANICALVAVVEGVT